VRKLLAVWLLALAAAQAYAFVEVRRFFVFTRDGQRLDWIALSGNSIGEDRIDSVVNSVLDALSVASVLGATIVIGFIALIRRRILLAVVATLLVAGANLTSQVLKRLTERPELGVDVERLSAGNSLPSGHTTLAASIAIALVLVLPAQVRALGALVGATYAAVAGVATMSAGWHRPSDAVASLLIVGAWAAVAGTVLVLFQRDEGFADEQRAHRAAVVILLLAAVAAFALAGVTLQWVSDVLTIPPDDLGRRRLLAAYAGSASGIAGTAALVMALFLASVHQVVPRRGAPVPVDA
jgi:membrane-associated phospholipid phosphatase